MVEVEVVGHLDWEVYQESRVEVGFAELKFGSDINISTGIGP